MDAAIYVGLGGVALGGYLAWSGLTRAKAAEQAVRDSEEELRLKAEQADRQRAEALLAGKAELDGERRELDGEYRRRRDDLQRQADRLDEQRSSLDQRRDQLDQRERELTDLRDRLREQQSSLERAAEEHRQALERAAGLTVEEARAEVLRVAEREARSEAARLARAVKEEARRKADMRARKMVALAVSRCAVDYSSDSIVTSVPLPSDEVKGRIIGREGRNIRSFEQLTGVDLIIDDTPEAVVISAFDPIRREVARLSLERLLADGRIHPGRIEEVVERSKLELHETVMETGERAATEAGVRNLAPKLIEYLGRLHYRTSYGQNVLQHSLEVTHLARIMASEIGADVEVCRRAALLHDIGKAAPAEVEGPHAVISMDLVRRNGESTAVQHAVGAHHRDIEPESAEAFLVLTADAISASRPGARRDSIETYIQRLSRLEEIAGSFAGVEKAYAVQAGREVRIMVRPEQVDDQGAADLAQQVAEKVQDELEYPGQIKITVIREQRATEYAT